MSLEQPLWLVLLVPAITALWLWRAPTRLLQGLRAAVLILLVLAAARPLITLPHRAGVVVVVADRSLSMPGDASDRQRESIELVERAMSPRDRLAVVSFGGQAVLERPPSLGAFAGFTAAVDGDASDLAAALDRALALVPSGAPGRLLVLSDGRWTGRDPMAEAGRAAARNVAIDHRLLTRPREDDLAIDRVDAPHTVGPGEGFLLTAWVRAPTTGEASYTLRRGDTVIASGTHAFSAGLNRLTFRDRAGDAAAAMQYRLEITAAGEDAPNDPVPENNRARLLVGVDAPRPILCISPREGSGLANLLRRAGLDVVAASADSADLSLEALSAYAAVVIENVPAEEITPSGMDRLLPWIDASGGGLMMTGGRHAFGPGGYFGSALDPILPVSMELRQEHRKLSLAIVVALDRSGSMSMPIGGGRAKMDLANLGTAQVLDLLSPMDEFGVLAVDSSAHVIAELGPLTAKEEIRSRILRIESMGGGIFVYEALSHAAAMLADAEATTRHIILFSDAMDSEEPGRYRELLEECRAANITVSVIGLGTENDVDAALLKDIAARGDGRIFFTQDATQLPRLFAQDTFVVARSSFIDEPTPVATTPALHTLVGRSFGEPPPVGGYNLTYLRPGAQLAAVTQDEYAAPLVAAWQAGAGRVAAYTGEADGEHAGPIAGWTEVGELFASLARWTAGEQSPLPDGMFVTHTVDRGVMRVQVHLDPERPESRAISPPTVSVVRGEPGRTPEVEEVSMAWASPDTLAADVALSGRQTVLATVMLPGAGHGPVRLSPVTLPYSPEFAPGAGEDDRRSVLEQLSAATGGVARVELPSIWEALPKVPQSVPLAPWLCLAAIVLLLMEVLERRTGVLSAVRAPVRRRQPRAAAGSEPVEREPKVTPRRRQTTPTSLPPPATPSAEPPPAPASPAAAPGLSDALRRARTQAQRRVGNEDGRQ